MKPYKITVSFKYTAIIAPIVPRITIFDSMSSILNLTGTYYNINANLDALCKASENIVKINEVWQTIGKDISKASDEFARINSISKLPDASKFLPKHSE